MMVERQRLRERCEGKDSCSVQDRIQRTGGRVIRKRQKKKNKVTCGRRLSYTRLS